MARYVYTITDHLSENINKNATSVANHPNSVFNENIGAQAIHQIIAAAERVKANSNAKLLEQLSQLNLQLATENTPFASATL